MCQSRPAAVDAGAEQADEPAAKLSKEEKLHLKSEKAEKALFTNSFSTASLQVHMYIDM